jgi:hypothetical protein
VHHRRRDKCCGIYVAKQKIRKTETACGGVNSIDAQFTLRRANVQKIVAEAAKFVTKFETVIALKPA